jgi:hypothetical protein
MGLYQHQSEQPSGNFYIMKIIEVAEPDKLESLDEQDVSMKIKILSAAAGICVATIILPSCKMRQYNQSKTKDLVGGDDTAATLCLVAAPNYAEASADAKASLRVACQGQCNGADYRNRKFYVTNEEKVHGYEFAVKLSGEREMRNLFIFSPENGIVQSLKATTLENVEVQKALANYGLDPANVMAISIPSDAKILMTTGSKASLSTAGLLDGGTLDCGGKPIDGSVDLLQFKEQNLKDVKNAATLP